MNSKVYIISKIDELAKVFPRVKFSYQMDELSETHFIEVLPKDFFEQSTDEFIEQQNNIITEFINKFPHEGLAFISEDDLFKMDCPEHVICGKDYQGPESNLSWNHEKLNELLVDFKPQIQGSFIVTQKIQEVEQNSVNCNFSLISPVQQSGFVELTNNLPCESLNTDVNIEGGIDDDNEYYLAA